MSILKKTNSVKDVDMTQGGIYRHIMTFALPLLIGNIFQQLYNTVDTWVVGNYVSNEAFSAVGTVGPIINTLIGFFTGLASGAGVVISQYYGAKRFDKVKDTVHTAAILTVIMSVIMTFVGIVTVPFMLRIMKTPDEVYTDAAKYLTIYFAGVAGLLIYNMGSGIMRAVGNSKEPFVYLAVAAIINTVLDLVFVIVFKMGVEGVAYATIIAQGVSAILVTVSLFKTDSCIKMNVSSLRLDIPILGRIFKVGIPAALQLAVTAFSNVFVQSYINFFGPDYMSGWTAYSKLDQLLFLPMQSVALAATTFVGQNLGKGNAARAKQGVRASLILSLAVTAILVVPVVIFASPLTAFFNSKTEVIAIGCQLLTYLSPFYLLCCFNQIYAGALRGAGKSHIPMIMMLSSFVVFRQLYLFVTANYISNTFLPIAFAYPAGWFLCSVITTVYYKVVPLDSGKLI